MKELNELTVFSHGLGTDSCTIMELFYLNPDLVKKYVKGECLVIFSDLGVEYPETYQQIERQKELCEKLGFKWIHLKPSMGFHPKHTNSTERATSIFEWWKRANAIGMTSGDKRCTDRWKINPIWTYVSDYLDKKYQFNVNTKRNTKKALYKFTEKKGKINLIIGFAKGEESRIEKASEGKADAPYIKKNVEKFFPLADLGFSRTDCHKVYEKMNQSPPRPSNCMFCFYQSPQELLYLKRTRPEIFIQWEEIEENKINVRGGNGVKGKFKLQYYLEKAKEKFDHLTNEELYKQVLVHGCNKGSW